MSLGTFAATPLAQIFGVSSNVAGMTVEVPVPGAFESALVQKYPFNVTFVWYPPTVVMPPDELPLVLPAPEVFPVPLVLPVPEVLPVPLVFPVPVVFPEPALLPVPDLLPVPEELPLPELFPVPELLPVLSAPSPAHAAIVPAANKKEPRRIVVLRANAMMQPFDIYVRDEGGARRRGKLFAPVGTAL